MLINEIENTKFTSLTPTIFPLDYQKLLTSLESKRH